MHPLVLAIEPDLRQAAIVKRIVREKVQADVTVVDSRDAALEAIRTKMPDVLLLSVLLSPRDETELIAHLRTLEDAQHLQTQTIPQLASLIGDGDEKPARGLLSAFRRRKESASQPSGCDPELFAEEVRTYLKRASEKKRELREALASGTVPTAGPASRVVVDPARSEEGVSSAEPAASSWSSPFEWRPSTPKPAAPAREARAETREPAFAARQSHVPAPPRGVVASESSVVTPAPGIVAPEPSSVGAEPAVIDVLPLDTGAQSVRTTPEPVATDSEYHTPVEAAGQSAADEVSLANLEPAIPAYDSPEAHVAPVEATVATLESARSEPALSLRKPRPPLVMRQARGWWYVEGKGDAAAADPESELREVLASLSVPRTVAAVGYAEGCRIRRVRLTAA